MNCKWTYDDYHCVYETECDKAFYFDDSSNLDENNFKFCPYCGKIIEAIIPQEQDDDHKQGD